MAKKLVCKTCGHYGVPQKKSFSSKRFCKKCKGEELVPADTPVGKKMLEDLAGEKKKETTTHVGENSYKKTEKQNEDTLKGLKWLGIIVLIYFGIVFWYIGVPAFVIWYLYKKDKKLETKTKHVISVVVTVLFLALGANSIHEARPPSLEIISPENNYSIQASSTTIVGKIDPIDAELTVDGGVVAVDESGGFNYQAPLSSESNNFTFKAKNGGKERSSIITIKRIFTEEEIAEREAQQEQAKIENEEKRVAAAKEKLQKEINSIAEFDSSTYRDDLFSLQMELALFGAWARIVNQYKNDANSEVASLANQMKQKVVAIQVREFPLIRKNYAEIAAKEMWESNVDVESLGSTHKTLQLTGGIFANNANKAEAQRTIQEVVKMFRFNRVNYKWYKYDDEYTYYEIESLPDSELVVI